MIQLTIRERFSECTVLTIAHRLNTIMDSDRVMVLDAGYLKVKTCKISLPTLLIPQVHFYFVQEFGEPAVLLENPKSMFYSLVEQTGPVTAAQLTEMAKQVFFFFFFFFV